MALISAFSIIRVVSVLHLTLAYFFLTNPRQIAEQNFVYILSDAMDLPLVTDFNKSTPVTAFLALVLAFQGLSDLLAVSISEPIAVEYWSAVTPLRLVFLFPLTGYVYLHSSDYTMALEGKQGTGDLLKNGVTFTWCFMETMLWFWVYVSMREQRKTAAERIIEARKAEMLR